MHAKSEQLVKQPTLREYLATALRHGRHWQQQCNKHDFRYRPHDNTCDVCISDNFEV